jgi:mono/diheme cytochrome c family protein
VSADVITSRAFSAARDLLLQAKRRHLHGFALLAICGCSWFTDFKEQPKIDPWDTPNDSTAARGNPQGSVPVYGTAAPEFMYARNMQALDAMSAIQNPTPMSQASLDRGRKAYQINCAVCHGPAGAANGPAVKFGVYPPALATGSAMTRADGYIFGIIRNGRNTMPPYNRIDEMVRWDIVNYVRALQGKAVGFTADTSHGRPGETGDYLPGATNVAPTRPAPAYTQVGSQAGAREGLTGGKPAAAGDTTKQPAATPAANKPPTPEAEK